MNQLRYILLGLVCIFWLFNEGNAQNLFPRKKIRRTIKKDTLPPIPHSFIPHFRPYGLVDAYYITTFRHRILSHDPLFQQYNVVRQLAINHLVFGLEARSEKYTVNIALNFGTYQEDSYTEEPPAFQFIREANIEVALDRDNHWLVDAGVTASPLGLELIDPYENLTLTYPMLSAAVPNFRTGVRLRYERVYNLGRSNSIHKNFGVAFSVLNGWGRIRKLPGNSLPSFSLSVGYEQPNDYAFHYNNLFGTDDPDPIRRLRFFQELNGYKHLGKKWILAFFVGAGFQQEMKHSRHLQYFGGGEVVGRYRLSEKLSAAARMEFFQDPYIILTPNWYHLNAGDYALIYGPAINVDYDFYKHFKVRAEYKYLQSKHPIFKQTNNTFLATQSQATFSMSWYF